MATSSFIEAEGIDADDGDVLGKALIDFDAKDACEISVKQGTLSL